MATATTARAPEIVNGTSRFPGSEFIESTTNPQGDRNSNKKNPMAQISQPQDQAPSTASSRPTSQDHTKFNNPTAEQQTHELIEISSNPLIEGVLGPNKDGRVRNPVPSKLKGKTNARQGNFGVMHLGINSGRKETIKRKDAAAERVAAARKTSEATAFRAKAAQSNQYVSPTKRINEEHSSNFADICEPSSTTPQEKPARTFAPEDIKYEQARLLTLLRSINPVTVVDQVCKAVAYFGGIPGAPPPEDGIFPQSANTRENGAIFIGWLAEIFPDLSIQPPPNSFGSLLNTDAKTMDPSVKITESTKRSESFSSDLPNPRNGFGFGPAVSGFAWGLPPSQSLVNNPSPTVPLPYENFSPNSSKQLYQQNSFSSGKEKFEEGDLSVTYKRKRGRPKGSRNKKVHSDQNLENEAEDNSKTNVHDQILSDVRSSNDSSNGGSSQSNPSGQQIPTKSGLSLTTAEPNQTIQCGDFWSSRQQNNVPPKQNETLPTSNELSPEDHVILEALKQNGPEAMNVVASPSVSSSKNSNIMHTPETGQKRKRAPSKSKTTPTISSAPAPTTTKEPLSTTGPGLEAATVNVSNTNLIDSNPDLKSSSATDSQSALCSLPLNNAVPLGMAKDTLQWLPNVDNTSVSGPPAKRSRHPKPNFPNSGESLSRNSTSAVQGLSASRTSAPKPPAEGLEAHYERFANLKQNQSTRNDMPTSLPQQQLLHKSKGSSTPIIQTKAQTPQQNVNQNISGTVHQDSQREDLTIAQGNSTRQPSSSFYSQRTQPSMTTASYAQQYPPQPSHIFSGHQTSSQMTDGTYRNSSTIPQPSGHFSPTDSSFETSSPHNISQHSPSFSQNEVNFRTSNTQTAQPSTPFSHSENAYRTSSSHSIPQSTPYQSSRPQTQAQPTQHGYNQFADSSFIDLPNLESLGHNNSAGNPNVNPSANNSYGQGIGVNLGVSRASSNSNNNLYGTGLALNAYDTGTSDLLRGVSTSGHTESTPYGTQSTAPSNAYDSASGQEIRERLLRGSERYR